MIVVGTYYLHILLIKTLHSVDMEYKAFRWITNKTALFIQKFSDCCSEECLVGCTDESDGEDESDGGDERGGEDERGGDDKSDAEAQEEASVGVHENNAGLRADVEEGALW